MLFIEWQPMIWWTVTLAVLSLCLVTFGAVRRRRALWRRTARSLAVLFLTADAFVISIIADSGRSYSYPVFSPDRSMAARVMYTDYRGERDADVEVFRRHGFSHDIVYEARPLLTGKEIHWLDTKNLWLVGLDPFFCMSTEFVAVHCGGANAPAAAKTSIVQRLVMVINAHQAQAPSPHPGPPWESRSAR